MNGKKRIIKNEKHYRVSDICNILGISKNTLYNWEKKKKIPKAWRDPMSGWRIYSEKDLENIKKISRRG